MDKNLLKLEKEKAKKQINQKLKLILTDKKGFWLYNLLCNALFFAIIFFINHIFHMDIDYSGSEVNYDNKEAKKEDKFTLKEMIINFLIIVVVCFICYKVFPFIADILFSLN